MRHLSGTVAAESYIVVDSEDTRFAGGGVRSSRQMIFEFHGLLLVEALEVLVPITVLEPRDGSGHAVNRSVAIALGFLQIEKIIALDALVCGAVLCHGKGAPIEGTV